MRPLIRNSLFSFILLGVCLSAPSVSRAQELPIAWCSPQQVDLDLGPHGDSPNSNTHWLTIELRNRLDTPCKLNAGLSGNGSSYNDSSPAAVAFQQNSQRIPPRGLVHAFLAWTSAPFATDGIVMDQCKMIDTMPITPFSDPWLEIRHLWARTCDGWWSSFRLGPYVPGEPIAKEWLDRVHLHESDFSLDDPPDLPNANVRKSVPLKLWTFSNVQYLQGKFGSGYYNGFHLILETSLGTFPDCPLREVRKREADGKTVIYLSSCSDRLRELPDSFGSKPTKAMGLWTSEFGLSPERTGRVEYSVVANILREGKPTSGEARTEVSVRDPNHPMLPVIDTNSPNCQIPQLKLTSPVVELGTHWDHPTTYPEKGEDWYDGKVFEFTNVSSQSCMFGGTPELKFLPWHSGGELGPSLCANCDNPFFKPRDIHWIDLKPNDSAHFIVVRLQSHLAYSYWCNATGGIDLFLPGDKQPIGLPFEATFCGPIHISAWRSGKYDGDPMNARFDRAETERENKWLTSSLPTTSKVVCVDNSKPKSQLPPPGPQCAELDHAKYGKPAMAPARNGISFGVSSSPDKPTHVNIWLDNQTDKPQPYLICCRSTFLSTIDIFDSAGHRLLSTGEQAHRKSSVDGKEIAQICSCSMTVAVPSHSMQVVDAGDLEDGYVLPPGRYFVVPSWPNDSSRDSINKTSGEMAKPEPPKGIMVIIQE